MSTFVAACTRRGGDQAGKASPVGEPDTTLAPTPECADDDEPTVEQTEGPFFTPNSPERKDLAADVSSGTKLVLTGTVLATDCRPVERALLDFWQADDDGNYDNDGYRLRGHQFTDAEGRYELRTIVPGLYPGRTRHIHVKVQAPNGRILTTQLYFPDEDQNETDGIYSPALLMNIADAADGKAGAFTFVVSRS